jgi:hypothetical protein
VAALVTGARPRCKIRTNDRAKEVLSPAPGLIRRQRLIPVQGVQRRNDFAPEFCTEKGLRINGEILSKILNFAQTKFKAHPPSCAMMLLTGRILDFLFYFLDSSIEY